MSNTHQFIIQADSRILETRPLFSVTTALYNVEQYLPATIESFKRQDIPDEYVEYIFVNDGSPDNSVDIARNFAQQHENVLVVSKENGGVGETRSVALELSRGVWVTSVDPDDLIRFNYFSEIKKILDADTENRISIISPRLFITNGDTGEFRDSHPLAAKHRRGNRVISMTTEPSAIHLAASAFTRLDVLREYGIDYDPTIKPTFEDAHLICRYLAHFENPIMAVASTAHFYYRKRANQSSLVQSAWRQPERYNVVPKYGYLAVLEYAEKQLGYIPNWLANAVLYDLMWYFKEESKMGSDASSIAPELKQEFLANAELIFAKISLEQFFSLPYNKIHWWMREAINRRFNLEDSPAHIFKFGRDSQGRRRYSVFVTPGEHNIEVWVDGATGAEKLEGVTNRLCFDQVFATEYKFSVSDRHTVFFVDRKKIEINELRPTRTDGKETDPYLVALTKAVRPQPQRSSKTKFLNTRSRLRVASGIKNQSMELTLGEKAVSYIQHKFFDKNQDAAYKEKVQFYLQSACAKLFKDCWILLDHADRADDNAEHLYRYIRNNRRDINAYFLIQKDSKDWPRLAAEGFKLLEYGSIEATAAILSADILASSDAIEECMYPAPRRIFGVPRYKYVFLQHGITVTDISKWLNTKRIDLVISATEDENTAFSTSDSSAYEFTEDQVALTGFARYDNLYREHRRKVDIPTLFIMPTWRNNMRNLLADVESQEERLAIFKETDYYKNWWGFFQNPRLLNLVKSGNLKVNLVLHPAFGNLLEGLEIPSAINFIKPGEASFQDIIKSSDIFLTDFSSLVFDCAYMGIPTCYFQFDYDAVFSGQHTYRKGYFDYHEHGLAPVMEDVDKLMYWIEEKAKRPVMDPIFAKRRKQTFRYFDDKNRERIVAAIEKIIL